MLPAVLTLLLFLWVVFLAGFIPTEMVRDGRLANDEERTVGALFSITVIARMITLVLVRTDVIGKGIQAVGRFGRGMIAAVFALNTAGNVFALHLREAILFTPITLLCMLLACHLALGRT